MRDRVGRLGAPLIGPALGCHGSHGSGPGAARTTLLLALVLMIPVLVAVNPVDPVWQAGWYDGGDTDQLVTQTMSPESMIGLAVLALACFSTSAGLLSVVGHRPDVCSSREPVPRGPPQQLPFAGQAPSACPHTSHLPSATGAL